MTTQATTFKAIIEYDGTDFAGWQVQPDQRTVQAEVESAIATILGTNIRVVAAGRTDAGVHAAGQVISFAVGTDMPPFRLKKAMNAVLPHDVTVLDIAEAPSGFNARFDATARCYRYSISTRERAIGRTYAWFPRYRLDADLLRAATEPLEGRVDLRGFSKQNEDDDYDTIIFKNHWTFQDDMMIFDIRAIRFFQHAVRGIVGSAVEVARGRQPVDFLARILATGDRSLCGPTAPARGLCLSAVEYGKDDHGTHA